jgi:site-specific DNA recombinase
VLVEQLDQYVWESVRALMQEPERVSDEWTRRGAEDGAVGEARSQRDEGQRLLQAQQQALRRLQDAYEAGALTLEELADRSGRVRARIRRAEEDFEQAQVVLSETAELKALAGKLSTFAEQIRSGLDTLDWNQRQQLVRTLVSRVEIDDEGATIVYRIPNPRQPGEPEPDSGGGSNSGGSSNTAGAERQLHSRRVDSVEAREVGLWS